MKLETIKKLIPTFCYCSLICYFIYNGIYSEHGLKIAEQIDTKLISFEVKLKELRKHKKYLEHKISLMRPEQLDPDTLDEQARKNLNLIKSDELIIIENSND